MLAGEVEQAAVEVPLGADQVLVVVRHQLPRRRSHAGGKGGNAPPTAPVRSERA